MATDAKLKAEVLKRLKVTPQRLSQLARRRKNELPMSTEQAVYTIAHEQQIDISKYLSRDETAEIRGLVSALRNQTQPAQPERAPRPARRRAAPPKPVKVTIAGVDLGKVPALKQGHAEEAKRMSEKVYPTLYIFENSVRDLIERVLSAKHGKTWWAVAVPRAAQDTAKRHREAEKKDPWHSPRGTRDIDYVFLNELWAIINRNWGDFKAFFPNKAWVESLITNDMNVSRRVLAHMNPLPADDIGNIKAAFLKWTKQLAAVEDQLP